MFAGLPQTSGTVAVASSNLIHSPKKIPVARPRLPPLAALAPYIERIDQARWYSNFGPLIVEFETRLAARYGLAREQLGSVANATLGLELALKSAGAKADTHCILPAWTFSASVHAAVEANLIPFFIDVEPDGLISPAMVREAIKAAPGEVGAVMPVAVSGQPIDPATWTAFSEETGLPVVIDAAPGFDSATVGSVLSVVSLHATKILGVGEGGFVMSTHPELLAAVQLHANFGFHGSREAKVRGTNAKLSEYAAAVGLAGLDEWPARRAAFQAAALRYGANLADEPRATVLPGWGPDWLSTTCVVQLDHPDSLAPVLDALHGAGVETRAWWGRGMHKHRAFAGYPRMALPNTEWLAETVLGLPFYIDITPEEVDTVCHALREGLVRCS